MKTGIPDLLPGEFASIKKTVLGNAGRYTQVKGTRQTARLAGYGSPAVRRALKDVEDVDVKLLHTFEMIQLDPLLLQALRNYDNYDVQNMGIEEVDRQQSEFRRYFDNLRLSCVYSMLSNGNIWFDGNGNLLPTSSGAVVTVPYNVQANNQNQLNGIIGSSWALVNTDIPKQLRNLKFQSRKDTGYELKYAFYGLNVPSYLTQNNYVIDYLSRDGRMRDKFVDSAEIPDGLFGFTWVPVYSSFFEDQNGTAQSFFGGDQVVFTPDITRDVYELLEGTYMVPSTFNATSDLSAALASLKQVTGMFSYGLPTHNPPTAELYYGDTQLPVWKVPNAMYEATVAF